MNTYSFRAETPYDAVVFLTAVVRDLVPGSLGGLTINNLSLGEVMVEVQTVFDFPTMQKICRSVTDGHVMLQTLRPVALPDNSLNRDYTIPIGKHT